MARDWAWVIFLGVMLGCVVAIVAVIAYGVLG
jgi:hypothetical protein